MRYSAEKSRPASLIFASAGGARGGLGPKRGDPVNLAPAADNRIVDDLADWLDLMDQASALAGRARCVLDIAFDIEHVEGGHPLMSLARPLADADRVGRAQAAGPGSRRVIRHD